MKIKKNSNLISKKIRNPQVIYKHRSSHANNDNKKKDEIIARI